MKNKVIWSEGMFLQPQHFQQQDRYFQDLLLNRSSLAQSYNWGIAKLSIDESMLALGKLGLKACKAILPDGTVLDIPAHDEAPLPLDLEEGVVDTKVYLALPLSRAGVPDAAYDSDKYRYRIDTIEVSDSTQGTDSFVPVQIGRLCLRLLLEHEDKQGYSCIAIARIQEVRANHQVVLDETFLPPCLDVNAVPGLTSLLQEMQSLLNYRGNMLVERLTGAATGAAEIADFMLLQIINRYEPLLVHYSQQIGLHPAQLYQTLIQLVGELSSFTRTQRRCPTLPSYVHDELEATFTGIVQELRRALSMVLEESALAIKLEERQANTWVAVLADKSLLLKANFILAVYAEMPLDAIRAGFPAQTKIAPVEEIRNLVNRALPGIELQVLQLAPRQIPFHSNYAYFMLNQEHALWKSLAQSAALAFHLGGRFPGLKLELWAVKR